MSHIYKINLTTEYIKQFKSRQKVELQCPFCMKNFIKTKHQIQLALWKGSKNVCCSVKCGRYLTNVTQGACSAPTFCAECKSIIYRTPSQKKSPLGNSFCSKSCAAKYNNRNKKTGYRRSKLECYIEEQLKTHYSYLNFSNNNRELIGLELDFFFPDLKLAFELNGIVHYEPIYGVTKFDLIQNNDVQKMHFCRSLGIELCVVDVSHCKTAKNNPQYWEYFKQVLDSTLARIDINI